MNKKGKKVTKKDYDFMKSLLENRVSYETIHNLTGRSSSTLSYIKRSNSYDEYLQTIHEYSLIKNGKVEKADNSIQTDKTQLDRIEGKLDRFLSFIS